MPEKEVEAPKKVPEVSSDSQENANESVGENKVQKPSFKRRNQAIYTAEEDEDNQLNFLATEELPYIIWPDLK